MISKTIVFAVSGSAAVQLKMDTNHVSIDIADSTDGVIEVPRQDTIQNKKRDGTKDGYVKVINNNEKETAALVTRPRRRRVVAGRKPRTICGYICDFIKCVYVVIALSTIVFGSFYFIYFIYSIIVANSLGDDCGSMKKYKAFWAAGMKRGMPCCVHGKIVPWGSDPACPRDNPYPCFDANGTEYPCEEDYYSDIYNETGWD